MSSSDPTPSFYSYSLTEMEGLNEIGDVALSDNTTPGNPLGNQFLFGLSQSKGESVTNFAIRVETTLANIRRDHPHQMDRNHGEASQRDRFFQGLKKT